ncbi:MAG: hypothetical protein IPM23_08270 [Candidatus Melainabacteria bacterium]|nr:hypothetical protein [Candidatus Melainabacteria bacterium]
MECNGLTYLNREQSVAAGSLSDPDGLIAFYLENRSSLDPDGDGFASRSEVADVYNRIVLASDPNAPGKIDSRAPHKIMHFFHDGLSRESNDEPGLENDGITLADLEAYKRTVEAGRPKVAQTQLSERVYSEPRDMLEFFKKHRQELDRNGDQFVDREEMEDLYLSGGVACGDIPSLKALYLYENNLEELSNDESGDENSGITLADMEAYQHLEPGSLTRGIDEVQQYSSGLIPVGQSYEDYDYFARNLPVAFGGFGAAIGAPIGFLCIGLTATAFTDGLAAPIAIPYGTMAGSIAGWTIGYFAGIGTSLIHEPYDFYKDRIEQRAAKNAAREE